MNNRELDCWIAEHVFGVVDNTFAGTNYIEHRSNIQHYSTDAAADYLVLERVMAKYHKYEGTIGQLNKDHEIAVLASELEKLQREREHCPHLALNYQPGDYSRAYAAACGVEV